MARSRYVTLDKATRHVTVSLRSIKDINEYAWDGEYLYYAKPEYTNDSDYTSILLMGFRIRKTTECYYMLECGMRISKNFDQKSFALFPQDAVKFCIKRTYCYFDILLHRLRNVQDFLKQTDCMRGRGAYSVKELRIFEDLAKQFKDQDEIPVELYRDFTFNPELKIGDILR